MNEEGQLEELRARVRRLRDRLDALQPLSTLSDLRALLRGQRGSCSAFLTISASESAEGYDLAETLVRLYARWSDRHGFDCRCLHFQPGTEAGCRQALLKVTGIPAYGYLAAEHGVHRFVRISPFDARNRRHTSFIQVEVLPDVSGDPATELAESTLRIEPAHPRRPGGQMVGMDTGVCVTHLPTGLRVVCEGERSQMRNKRAAVDLLRARLAHPDLTTAKPDWPDTATTVRSYVIHPHTRVADRATGVETDDVRAVLDGQIDPFIFARVHRANVRGNIGSTNDENQPHAT